MAYNGPYGWSPTGVASGFARDPNDSSRYFFQNQQGQFIGDPMGYDQLGQYFSMGTGHGALPGPQPQEFAPGIKNYFYNPRGYMDANNQFVPTAENYMDIAPKLPGVDPAVDALWHSQPATQQAAVPNQFNLGPGGTLTQNPDFWNNPQYVNGYNQYRQWEDNALAQGANLADQQWSQLSNMARNAAFSGQPMPPADITGMVGTHNPNVPGNYEYSLPEYSAAPNPYASQAPAAPATTGLGTSSTPTSVGADWTKIYDGQNKIFSVYRDPQGREWVVGPNNSYIEPNTRAEHADVTRMPRLDASSIYGGTSSSPTATPGTSTAQSYNPYSATGPATQSNAMTGPAPLTNAVQQGFGMGLSGFNPQWYDQLGQSLYSQANKNFLENINPQIQSGAQLAGQYGGNRAAIAQGQALGQLNQNVMNAMAPQYAQGYENSLNRGLQTGQAAMGGLLGLGQLDLGSYNADTQRQLGLGQLDINKYNAQAGNTMYTNPWAAGLGGALGLSQLFNLWK